MTNSSMSVIASPAAVKMASTTTTSFMWDALGLSSTSPFPHLVANNNDSSLGWNNNGSHGTMRETEVVESGGGEGGGVEGEGWCQEWRASQHTLFQLAHLCCTLAFLSPATFRFHLTLLRALLLLASGLQVVWAAVFVCMADVLGWSLVFLTLNAGHLVWRFYRRAVSTLPHSQTAFYSKVFRPVKVSEREFRELCQQGALHTVSQGALYAIEGATPCGHLSVLLKGRLKVTYKRLLLHHVEMNQFVDATEYDYASSHQDHRETYQVSIVAAEDSVLLRWDYNTLQDYLSSRPFLHTLLHFLTGKDVCSHLYALQEQLMQTPDYMTTLPSRHSSMVNVRSCLAAQDSSTSLAHLPDHPDDRTPREASITTSTLSRALPSVHIDETCL